ncbi:putative solute carrier family 13 [Helianthus debilis subsp. tardiflorus]
MSEKPYKSNNFTHKLIHTYSAALPAQTFSLIFILSASLSLQITISTNLKPQPPPMESTALFSTTFRPPSLHLRSRLSKPISPFKPPFLRSSPPPYPHSFTTKPLLLLKPICASATSIPQPTEPKTLHPQGAKIVPLTLSIAIGLLLRFLIPKPPDVTPQAWQLLSIFLSTIAGLVLSPLPVGAWAFVGLTTSIITKTLTFKTAFSAFTNEVIWLIVISFFFARGFVKTGLGDRIATYFVKWLGKSTLGLSYGLALSETLIAPAMPSTTARAGGVFLPIIKSLAVSGGSKPNDPSSRKLGAYLVQSQFQCAGNSSALFLTAAAQNLLCLKLAEELGLVIANPWISWFKAASLPAFVSLLLTPYILYKIYPPETKDTPDAPAMAEKRLQAMGPVTTNEWIMIGTMLLAVSLWVFGDAIGIPSVVTAMLGLSILLLLGVLEWNDCLSEKSAWDTLAWFAVLVGMAGQLTNLGIVTWMSNCVAKFLQSFSLSWPAAFGVLQAAYFFIHYMFASQTGHVGALYSAFLAMHLAAGVPAVLAALALAYNTNLFGAQTHYSSGQAAVYFGAGYVELPDVFRIGFIMACINAVIWSVVGGVWWKFLGLY